MDGVSFCTSRLISLPGLIELSSAARARNAGSRRQPPYMAVLQDLTHCHLVKKVDSDKVVQKRMKDHLPIRALIRT